MYSEFNSPTGGYEINRGILGGRPQRPFTRRPSDEQPDEDVARPSERMTLICLYESQPIWRYITALPRSAMLTFVRSLIDLVASKGHRKRRPFVP